MIPGCYQANAQRRRVAELLSSSQESSELSDLPTHNIHRLFVLPQTEAKAKSQTKSKLEAMPAQQRAVKMETSKNSLQKRDKQHKLESLEKPLQYKQYLPHNSDSPFSVVYNNENALKSFATTSREPLLNEAQREKVNKPFEGITERQFEIRIVPSTTFNMESSESAQSRQKTIQFQDIREIEFRIDIKKMDYWLERLSSSIEEHFEQERLQTAIKPEINTPKEGNIYHHNISVKEIHHPNKDNPKSSDTIQEDIALPVNSSVFPATDFNEPHNSGNQIEKSNRLPSCKESPTKQKRINLLQQEPLEEEIVDNDEFGVEKTLKQKYKFPSASLFLSQSEKKQNDQHRLKQSQSSGFNSDQAILIPEDNPMPKFSQYLLRQEEERRRALKRYDKHIKSSGSKSSKKDRQKELYLGEPNKQRYVQLRQLLGLSKNKKQRNSKAPKWKQHIQSGQSQKQMKNSQRNSDAKNSSFFKEFYKKNAITQISLLSESESQLSFHPPQNPNKDNNSTIQYNIQPLINVQTQIIEISDNSQQIAEPEPESDFTQVDAQLQLFTTLFNEKFAFFVIDQLSEKQVKQRFSTNLADFRCSQSVYSEPPSPKSLCKELETMDDEIERQWKLTFYRREILLKMKMFARQESVQYPQFVSEMETMLLECSPPQLEHLKTHLDEFIRKQLLLIINNQNSSFIYFPEDGVSEKRILVESSQTHTLEYLYQKQLKQKQWEEQERLSRLNKIDQHPVSKCEDKDSLSDEPAAPSRSSRPVVSRNCKRGRKRRRSYQQALKALTDDFHIEYNYSLFESYQYE